MPRLLLLAAGDPYRRHVARLRKERYEVIALDRNPAAQAYAGADAFVLASVSDAEAVTAAARTHRVDAIIAATEAGVRAAAEASRRLGLPGLSVEAACAATDKADMRKRWAAAGLRQPRFEVAATCEEATQIIGRVGCPCVVKPTRGWASKSVSIATNEADIDLAVADALAVHGGPIIIEDFVPGRLLSAEGFVSDHAVDVVVTADVRLQDSDRHRVNMALCFPGNFERRVMAAGPSACQARPSSPRRPNRADLGSDNARSACESRCTGRRRASAGPRH
jgi:carbamoylphosphate synthase large subunit